MFLKPYFFDTFKCKAGDCTDSCCIGWEIDIDSDSLEKYSCVKGEFGERLKNNIVTEADCLYFKLCDGDRCPFLNNDNLCDIYINMGEESLCSICKEHPRFYNEFAGRCEAGIGLCCEKVCEILFADDSPLEFILEDDGYDDNFDSIEEEVLLVRQKIFNIITDRSVSFFDRLKKLQNFNIDIKKIIDAFSGTEPINDEWKHYILNVQSVADKLCSIKYEFTDSDYEKLFMYIVYRHFTKAIFDGETEKWLSFCIVNLLFIHIMDLYTVYNKGEYTSSDRIENVKMWSKQIEYDEDNIKYLTDCF